MDCLKNLASVEEEEDDDDEEDEDYDPTKDDLENDDADKGDGGDDDDSDESGDDDDDDSDGEDGSKREKKRTKKRGRKRKACSSIDNAENVSGQSATDLTVDEKKKKADDLWAELNDSSPPQPKPLITTKESNEEKVVEKVYDFAGEKVVVKETDKTITSSSSTSSAAQSAAPSGIPTMRRSGLKDLVSNLGKKNKLGTLMKSKFDWDTFKREQGIEDELKRATLNKDGYVERQAFLSRADVRQFELEKSIRSKVRKPQ